MCHLLAVANRLDEWDETVFTTPKCDYIDRDFLIAQRERQNNNCFYCHCYMVIICRATPAYRLYVSGRISLSRKTEDLCHVKYNTVLACRSCVEERRKAESSFLGSSFSKFYKMKNPGCKSPKPMQEPRFIKMFRD